MHFELCRKLIDENPTYPMSSTESDKQWRVHTCFESCKDITVEDYDNFLEDTRPECSEEIQKEESIICVHPYVEDNCETYQKVSRYCFDEDKMLCFGWREILIAILCANTCQVLFETALAYSIEITFKPTKLDRMQDPENYDEEQEANNPDQKFEPSCSTVMAKCWGELVAIIVYLLMLGFFIISLIHHMNGGKPLSSLIEFGIALVIDQLKHIPI